MDRCRAGARGASPRRGAELFKFAVDGRAVSRLRFFYWLFRFHSVFRRNREEPRGLTRQVATNDRVTSGSRPKRVTDGRFPPLCLRRYPYVFQEESVDHGGAQPCARIASQRRHILVTWSSVANRGGLGITPPQRLRRAARLAACCAAMKAPATVAITSRYRADAPLRHERRLAAPRRRRARRRLAGASSLAPDGGQPVVMAAAAGAVLLRRRTAAIR
jgi:hypothetical protein